MVREGEAAAGEEVARRRQSEPARKMGCLGGVWWGALGSPPRGDDARGTMCTLHADQPMSSLYIQIKQ